MHTIRNTGPLNQMMNSYSTTPNHLYPREPDLDPGARYGIMIALAISSGAFFVACIGLTISLCDWRMRYLHLRKEMDERGFALADRTAAPRQETGREQAEGQEAAQPNTASGAL
ncbi:hypothetical protein QQS21_012005 [Conoideocrella luteorostrata]|uniref:Uncharacterized protein n=1 Tax=Conoideocrella luteorostrata TaxID=1105319 RepID=A0AAJ0CC90_9HYPO|nr:hypothetical protein QQS21_012005 [Conoideocrella luteorostrata]